MAPFNTRAIVHVLSTQVVSHNETTILVEAGGFTPMRWFLERGDQSSDSDDSTSDSDDAPPKKRQKLAYVNATKQKAQDKPSSPANIDSVPLARVTLDFVFPTVLGAPVPAQKFVDKDVDFSETEEIPVILYGTSEYNDGTQIRLAQPRAQGVVLKMNSTEIPSTILDDLRTIASPGRQKQTGQGQATNEHPATITRCVLKRSMGDVFNIVRLEASIVWRDGVSAFPSGYPLRRLKVSRDHDLLDQFFPDSARDEVDHTRQWTPQDFYESVHVPEIEDTPEFNNVMDTELYPFQQRSVKWMLRREGVRYEDGKIAKITRSETKATQIPQYEQCLDCDGTVCFVNRLEGIVSRTDPYYTFGTSGGLLAEEMGLGKTLEAITLVSLHKSDPVLPGKVYDIESGTHILPSKATLIVTPANLLGQWASELGHHAPFLKVMTYHGIQPASKRKSAEQETLEDLTQNYDVILSSYHTLTREVHFAEEPPERNMRHARKFERPRSPLIQVRFWRIIMDEAQMVESGVAAAARVACRLPRVHNWALSGTPLRKNHQDLQGLLVFLRFKPLDSDSKLWSHLIANHRHLFKQIFGLMALRHTKSQVHDQLHLPPQKRVVVTLPFTAVEDQHYNTMFAEMCDALGTEVDGSPKNDNWDPEDPRTADAMRKWLVRLRQTCLHPQVGEKNRRALGRGEAPLRTVAEVLDVMIDQNEINTRSEERSALTSQLSRAHIIGNNGADDHRAEKALDIYRDALQKSTAITGDARQRLDAAILAQNDGEDALAETDDEGSSDESTPLIGRLRSSLRTALELQHVCTFFAATACYQIKTNEALTVPDSADFKRIEARETELYEQAKELRREILHDASRKAEVLMKNMRDLHEAKQLTKLPKIKDLGSFGGIESRKIVEMSDKLFDNIREMSSVITKWRSKMAEFLLQPLVDEDTNGNEITGDEYEDSTKQQDELYVYFDALRSIHADLNTFITGETAPLIDHEVKVSMKLAKRTLDPNDNRELFGVVHAPELLLKLFALRGKFRSREDELGSVRGLIQQARSLQDSLLWQGQNSRAETEAVIVKQYIASLQSVFTSYTKALAGLDKEVALFRTTQNQRLHFYKQLQELSDAVAPYKDAQDESLDTQALESVMKKEERHNRTIAQNRTKYRFLIHLRDEDGSDSAPKICVICQSPFENGKLTVCGHQYCSECIMHWWHQHKSCPVCKRQLAGVDFHDITYLPQELRAQEETQALSTSLDPKASGSNPSSSSPSQPSTIYSEVDSKLMSEIKAIELSASYGTKIDTLARHLFWIREHDPGAKSIVFSQYRQFLTVLSDAFKDLKLGYARLGLPGAVEKFKHNPSVDCLLLDAKTDSSGLTLVNATHVFICEPLIQTAVELQAIARVHRIGQTRQTTVWMYLINDTVEESIYELSVARRMAHVQSKQQSRRNEKSRSTTPAPLGEQAIDAANTDEMQSATLSKLLVGGKHGGEMVENNDLWQCLFGKAGKRPVQMGAMQDEFDREVSAHAAEQRRPPTNPIEHDPWLAMAQRMA